MQLVLHVNNFLCTCSVLAPKCSRKGTGDELAILYLNRRNEFKYLSNNEQTHPLKETVKSSLKMYGLPTRSDDYISMRSEVNTLFTL